MSPGGAATKESINQETNNVSPGDSFREQQQQR